MPLTMTAAGETATIKKVGGNEEVRRHLENLGFVTGGKDVYKRQGYHEAGPGSL